TPDGFYCSGDLLRKRPDGNYVVEGRKKDVINRGGEKISAEEVENLLLMHPAVHNVACVPMPDRVLGEKMCAVAVFHADHPAALESRYYMRTFNRLPVVFDRGEGCYLYDQDGRAYLDLVAGIAVNILGHAHPALVDAITTQAKKLLHTSSLYYSEPQLELAEW